MTSLPISEIQVGERDRADLGDIAALAESIKAVGLLHPIVVTADHSLVAGDRRLSAVRSLGWTEVDVTVVDLSTAGDVLKAEADENTCRKGLSPYEASRARERRARVLAEDAAKRTGGRPPKGQEKTGTNLEPVSARKTKNVGAAGTGYSGSTLDKVDKIRDIAERGVVRQGKTEVPAPAEVVEIAKKAVEQVKQTGAAVERSAREVDEAVEAYVATDPDVQQARLAKEFFAAFRRVNELTLFDPERVASALDQEFYGDVVDGIANVNRWMDRLAKARGPQLRIIGGNE